MADYGYTSHLLTIPVVLESLVSSNSEIISKLGYDDKGVTKPASYVGVPVAISPTQTTEEKMGVKTLQAGETPVGTIATRLDYDSNIGKFVTDIKLLGVIMEGFATSDLGTNTKVGFGLINPVVDTDYRKVHLPSLIAQPNSPMTVINARPSVSPVWIHSVYIPFANVLNQGAVSIDQVIDDQAIEDIDQVIDDQAIEDIDQVIEDTPKAK